MAKRERRQQPQSWEDLDANLETFIQTFQNESDRGAVLVATALLDEVLERVLRSEMSQEPHIKKRCVDPLFMPEASLGTFSAKVKVARAFNILADWMYEDLELIRKVRNEFAHSHLEADFSGEKIIKLSHSLKALEHAPKVFDVSGCKSLDASSEARYRFLLSASCLIFVLERGAALYWLKTRRTEIQDQVEAEGDEF